MRRRGLVAAFACLVLAPAAPAGRLPLPTRLASALAVRGISSSASAAVAVDLMTGQTVFARNGDLPLAPASNEKLTGTYSALLELGPAYRFRTDVVGTGFLGGDVWHGNLVLKGFGDPTLTSLGLDRLATQLQNEGIVRVPGRVLGDESWFDSRRTAPGRKPSFLTGESAPLSALVVDRAVYDHHVALQPALAAAGRFRQMLRSAHRGRLLALVRRPADGPVAHELARRHLGRPRAAEFRLVGTSRRRHVRSARQRPAGPRGRRPKSTGSLRDGARSCGLNLVAGAAGTRFRSEAQRSSDPARAPSARLRRVATRLPSVP